MPPGTPAVSTQARSCHQIRSDRSFSVNGSIDRQTRSREDPSPATTRTITVCGATPQALSFFKSRSERVRPAKATESRLIRGSSNVIDTAKSGGICRGTTGRSSPLARRWATSPWLPKREASVSLGRRERSPSVVMPSQRKVSIISSPPIASRRADRSSVDRNPMVSSTM